MIRIRFNPLLLVLLLVVLLVPAQASAESQWLATQTIGTWDSSSNAQHIASGVDDQGNGLLVATTPTSRLVAYERAPGGDWSDPVDVGPGVGDVHLVVGPEGTAAVFVKDPGDANGRFELYVRDDGEWTRRDAPDTATNLPSSRLAVGPAGEVAFAFTASSRPYVFERTAAGTWDTTPKRLDEVSSREIRLGFDAAGELTVTWVRDVPLSASRQESLVATTREEGTAWPSTITPEHVADLRELSGRENPSTIVYEIELGVGPAGDAAIAWTDFGYYCEGACGQTVAHAVTRSPDGDWGTPAMLSAVGSSARKPVVAIDGDGRTTVAWAYQNPTSTSLHYADRERGGSEWIADALDMPAYGALRPSVLYFKLRVNEAGDAVAAWTIDQNGGGEAFNYVMATVRPAGGEWDLSTLAFSPTLRPRFQTVSAALDRDGNALVSWQAQTSSPSTYSAKTATFDGSGPRVISATVPDDGQVGEELSFAIEVSDVSGPVADEDIEWTFGVGQGGATGRAPKHTYDAPGTYTVSVRVTDASGMATTRSWSLVISDTPNVPPTASFTAQPNEVETDEPVSFDATASNDPDGTITAYEWDFDGDGGLPPTTAWDHDGDPGTPDVPLGDEVELAFSHAGAYPVRLRVRDDDGDWSGMAEQVVTVTAPEPPPGGEPTDPDPGPGTPPGPAPGPPATPPASPSPADDPAAGLKVTAPPFRIVASTRRRVLPDVIGRPVDRAREMLDQRHYIRYVINWVHSKPNGGNYVIGDVVFQAPKGGTVEDSAIGDFLRVRLDVYAGPRNRSKACAAGFKRELPGTDFDLGKDLIDEARCVKVDDIDLRLVKNADGPEIAKAKVGKATRKGRELDLTVHIPRDRSEHDLFLVFSEFKPGNLHTFGDDWALTVDKNNCFRVQVFDRDRALIQNAEVRIDLSDVGGADPPRLLTDANGEVRYCAGGKNPIKPNRAGAMDVVAFATGRDGETVFGAGRVKAVSRKGNYRTPSGRQVRLSNGRYFSAELASTSAAFDLGSWLGGAWTAIATPFKALGDGIKAAVDGLNAAMRQGGWDQAEKSLGAVPGNFNPGSVLSPGAGVISAGSGNVIAAGAGNVISAGGGNVISAGGGNVVSAGALNFVQSALNFLRSAGHVISAGAGNVISAGAGNVISAGAGNVIAAGGGNVISAGGGNVISAGAGNVISAGSGNFQARPSQAGASQAGSGIGFRATAQGVVLRLSTPAKGANVPVATGIVLLGDGEFAAGVKDARKSDVLQLSDDVWVLREQPSGGR